LRAVASVSFDGPETRVVGRLYETTHDGPFVFADGEVVDHCWLALADIDAWADDHPICDDTRAIVMPYLRERVRGG
jgi:hypothetical protein